MSAIRTAIGARLMSGLSLAFLPGSAGWAAAAVEPPVAAVFQAAAHADMVPAGVAFARLHARHPHERDIAYGLALTLAVSQPRTESNKARAAQLLEAVADGHGDALAAEASYQRARMVGAMAGADADAGEAGYRLVWEKFPGTLQAERAFVFYAIARQHAPLTPAVRRRELIRLDAQATAMLTQDSPRRMYHLAASTAWARLAGDEARARDHLLVVHTLGLADDFGYSNVIVRLAEYHRRAGDSRGALRFYREFLAKYPSDRRTDVIGRWVKRLEDVPNATR